MRMPDLSDSSRSWEMPWIFFVLHQLGDLFEQVGLVHLVRQLGDDDGLAAVLLVGLDRGARAHVHPSAAGAISLADTLDAGDDRRGREIRTRDMLHQRLDVRFGLVDEREAGVDDLVQIVWRDVGRHANGDAGRTIDQQVRQLGRQHQRLMFRAVVVGREVDRFLLKIGQHPWAMRAMRISV